MKRKLFLSFFLFVVLCVTQVFADEEPANVIDVYGGSELTDVLKGNPGSNGPVTVRLNDPRDAYDKSLRLPDNVTLDLNGQTITGGITISGNGVSVHSGTVAGTGIVVKTNDSRGTIEGVTIKNARGTAIYLNNDAAIGNITNNTIINAGEQGIYLRVRSSCGNIVGNTITGVKEHAIRIVGTSSSSSNVGCVAGDITDNVISNCGGSGISLYYGSHCGSISRNTLTNLGGVNKTGDYGIIVSAACPFKSYASEITYNTVDTVTSAGIVVFSGPDGDKTGKWQDYGYIQGDIAFNTVKNCVTKKISGRTRAAIYVDNHARVYGSIHDNTVENSKDNGISVISFSRVHSIDNNTIKKVGTYGILAGSKGKIDRVIGNTIVINKASKGIAILCNSPGCYIGTITGNNISGKYHTGIRIKSPTGRVTIKSNTIKSSSPKGKRSVGIYCEHAKKIVVTGNKITGNKTAPGIYLVKCKGTVKKNSIKRCSHKVYKR